MRPGDGTSYLAAFEVGLRLADALLPPSFGYFTTSELRVWLEELIGDLAGCAARECPDPKVSYLALVTGAFVRALGHELEVRDAKLRARVGGLAPKARRAAPRPLSARLAEVLPYG